MLHGRVFQVSYNHYHLPGQMAAWRDEFQKKFNADFYTGSVIHIYTLLGEAMANALNLPRDTVREIATARLMNHPPHIPESRQG